MDQIQVIVLAAGLGKRMKNNELPKVLVPLKGTPLIVRLMNSIKQAEICDRPVVVIGQMADKVRATLGPDFTYVLQKELLGTGHAVRTCEDLLKGRADQVMVLYGDHPLLTSKTITKLAKTHLDSSNVLTMSTITMTDFDSWRNSFWEWGRVIRDANGKITRIVEYKDATREERLIKEVNPSFFCFQADWLWSHLPLLKNDNAQREYYLTDLVEMAIRQKQKITMVPVKQEEAVGINTPEQLIYAKKLLITLNHL